jgi:hypothetical protein
MTSAWFFFRCLFHPLCTFTSCPHVTYSSTTHNANVHAPGGTFFQFSWSLFILYPCLFLCLDCPGFFFFLSLLTNKTQTSNPSAGFEPAIPARSVATDLRPLPHGQRDRQEIRTRDLSNQATTDLSLRLDGHSKSQDLCSLLLSLNVYAFGMMTECYSSDIQLHGKKDNHLLHFNFNIFVHKLC